MEKEELRIKRKSTKLMSQKEVFANFVLRRKETNSEGSEECDEGISPANKHISGVHELTRYESDAIKYEYKDVGQPNIC